MKLLILAFWVAELLVLAWYIKSCWPVRTRRSLYVKMLCASVFLAYGITLAALIRSGVNVSFAGPNNAELSAGANTFVQFPAGTSTTRVVHLILWALGYGWLGDLFLGLSHQVGDGKDGKKTAMNALGVLAFLLGHVLYTVGFGRAIYGYEFGLHWWSILFYLLPVAVYLCIGLGLKLGNHLVPLGVYFLAVGAMFGTAMTLGLSLWSLSHVFSLCLCAGSLFFALGDLLLSLETYGGDRFKKLGLRITRQVAYFTGQMLLATTILFFYTV